MTIFKINDKVLCQGQVTSIRDIYTRVVRDLDGNFTTHTTYRLQDKSFWYTEYPEDLLTRIIEKKL